MPKTAEKSKTKRPAKRVNARSDSQGGAGKEGKRHKLEPKEVCKKLVDRITSSRTFEPFDKPTVGCRFHRFKIRGESIEGRLGFPIQNFRISTSYPLELKDGKTVEIVGNKLLHKQIREGGLCGQQVRITYQGRQFTHGGHHRKIYRVFKLGG